jgi:hypothetical protein
MHSDPLDDSGVGKRGASFGEFLVAQGIIQTESLRQARDAQHSMGGRLDTVLLDLDVISESVLLDALGNFYATRTVSAAELARIPPEVVQMVSPRIAERLHAVPFRLDGRTLNVATLDPGDLLIEDELSLLTDCLVASFVTLEVRLFEALNRLYGVQPTIQVVSVVNRLRDEQPAPASEAQPSPPTPVPPGEEVPEPAPSSATEFLPSIDGRPGTSEQPLVLEISQEDLDQFPSLRTESAGEKVGEPKLHARAPDRPQPAGPEERLQVASDALQNAEMREDIADALLGFCAPILRRRLLLAVRDDIVIGWRGEGEGIDETAIRSIAIPLAEPSVFVGLTQGTEFWLGRLPKMPRNKDLVHGIGGVPPTECIILPLILRSKTVCFLYGDNVDDSVTGLPISQLRRLVAKASLAFQVYLLKSKIRNL